MNWIHSYKTLSMKLSTLVKIYFFFSTLAVLSSGRLLAQNPIATINPPSASTTTILAGGTLNFTATRNGNKANWPGGNSSVTYTWNSTGTASVGFSPASTTTSNNNASTVGTFSTVGTYHITCTVQEGGGGLSATSASKTVVVVGVP